MGRVRREEFPWWELIPGPDDSKIFSWKLKLHLMEMDPEGRRCENILHTSDPHLGLGFAAYIFGVLITNITNTK